MFGILVSAVNTVLGFVFRQIIVKFVVLFALFFVIQAFVSVLSGLIPNPANMTSGLSGIASGSWWFMDLFGFSQGASMVVSALVYRFLIRRIPVIG